MNLDLVLARTRVVKLIRAWFDQRGFTEMLTPRMVGLPGQEPYLEPFWTEVRCPNGPTSDVRHAAALVTSPEYAMKRLLAAGLDKIYDLGPCFRNNEPWDGTHDPEFLMLEWYRRDSGLEDLMRDTEEMVRYVSAQWSVDSGQSNQRPLPSSFFFLPSSFRRLTVEQAWREYAGVELSPLLGDRPGLAKAATEKFNQTVTDGDDWDDIYFKIFLSVIEPHLGTVTTDSGAKALDPVFLYRYPASQASLSRKCSDDPRWADRVEFYMGPFELANGFAELCDENEQRLRFEEERQLRAKLGKKTWPSDEKFLKDLPKMGNAAGIAFGVERLAMLLTGSDSINDILPFPARERFENG